MTTQFRYGPIGSHGTDPEYISAMEHFEGIPHEQIYAGTQQIDATQILAASLVWLQAAGTVTTSMPITRTNADQVIGSADWEGPAAEAALAGTRSFAASVDELAAVLGEVGARLGAVAAAAEAVKLAVAPPGDSGPIGAIARALESVGVIDARMAQETLRQEAVLAMNMIYKPAYSTAGSHVPALPRLPDSGSAGTGSADHTPAPRTPATPSVPDDSATPPEAPVSPPQSRQPATPDAPPPPQTPEPQPPQTPDQAPTQQVPPPSTDTTTPPPPTPEPPPPPTPEPPPTTTPEPPPAPAPTPEPPPAPTTTLEPPPAPAPAPAPPDPSPGQAIPAGPPLIDQGGQPGITGPVPDDSTAAPTPDQPGVIPPGG
ncbi:hypothetical protein [Nocardia sp. alder85J]|uniref:hypothetical protein n=1 Tax=Nocardia sp. alder85J TaxID=2862949 RepID=UPI001CD1B00A|nr:hypothetical protein [Nocardia sp. alder85J]MCX4097449.1 hypothetical protein [Nocardia sp. alder85J]